MIPWFAWFCLGWCRRCPEHWVGTQLNIGSCLWITPKDYSLTACTVSCEEWGLPMYSYFMCSCACSGFGVGYPPILAGYGHWVGCKLNSIAVLFSAKQYPTNQLTFVGGKSNWSFPLVISIHCKTVTEMFESMLISRSAVAESISKEMLEIWLSSCSSHYVECTKTWMRGFSSVCGSLNSQPNHTRIAAHNPKRATEQR